MSEETVYDIANYLHGYLTDTATTMRRRATGAWAKRRRLKKVICPVTGDLTDHPSGLSGAAWRVLRRGVQALVHDREIEGAAQPYHAHGSWLKAYVTVSPAQRASGKSFQLMDYLSLIQALTGQEPERVSCLDKGSDDRRLEARPVRGSEYAVLRLTPQQADAVMTFGAALEALLRQTAEENYQRGGSALMVRLATGGFDLDDLNEAQTRRGTAKR